MKQTHDYTPQLHVLLQERVGRLFQLHVLLQERVGLLFRTCRTRAGVFSHGPKPPVIVNLPGGETDSSPRACQIISYSVSAYFLHLYVSSVRLKFMP